MRQLLTILNTDGANLMLPKLLLLDASTNAKIQEKLILTSNATISIFLFSIVIGGRGGC